MEKALPFWKWKEQVIKEDSESRKCDQYLRPREWYWKNYGKYRNKVRSENLVD